MSATRAAAPTPAKISAISEFRSVEHRNNDDCAEVVDDRQGQQKYLQRRRRPRPQQGQYAEREGNVCRGRDGPAPQRLCIAPVAGEIDECRAGHSTQCPDHRQRGIGHARQLARYDRALDLEPDEHEEDRHQPVVNPQQHRLGNGETTDLDRDREIQELRVERLERRVRQGERNCGGRAKDNAAGRLQLEELLNGGQGCKGRAFTLRWGRVKSDLITPELGSRADCT